MFFRPRWLTRDLVADGRNEGNIVWNVANEGAIRIGWPMPCHHLISVLPLIEDRATPKAFHLRVVASVEKSGFGDLSGLNFVVVRPRLKGGKPFGLGSHHGFFVIVDLLIVRSHID